MMIVNHIHTLFIHSFILHHFSSSIYLFIQYSIHSSVNVIANTFVMQLPTSFCLHYLFMHSFDKNPWIAMVCQALCSTLGDRDMSELAPGGPIMLNEKNMKANQNKAQSRCMGRDWVATAPCFQATFKGWMDIMYAAVDAQGVSLAQCLSVHVSPSPSINLV